MAKKIVLTAAKFAGYNKVLVKVTEQTNLGYTFGVGCSNTFRASNGIILGSNNYPARDKVNKDLIWLRGADRAKADNSFAVGAKRFERLAAAVREYNAYFADRCAPAPKKVDTCTVVVG